MSEAFESAEARLTNFRRSFLPPLTLSGGVILLDVLNKIVVRGFASPVVLAPQLSIRATDNVSGPFNLGSRSLVGMVSVVVLLLCAILFLQTKDRYERYGLALILGGGIANLAERIFFHRVTDILVIGTSAWNVADGAVIVGALLVAVRWISRHRQSTIR